MVLKTAHQLDETHGARASNLVHATPETCGKSMSLRSIVHSAATSLCLLMQATVTRPMPFRMYREADPFLLARNQDLNLVGCFTA